MSVSNGSSYVLNVGDIEVQVTHKRVKNVNLRIGSDGVAKMSAPLSMRRGRVEQIAWERYSWLREHMARVQDQLTLSSQEWLTGDTVWLWGEELRLEVCPTNDGATCLREGDVVRLYARSDSTFGERDTALENLFVRELGAELGRILPDSEREVGCTASHITLRRMKTRWGSCTSKTRRIRLNTALAECPRECTRMVLIHELCHIKEPNHGARFHALMDLHCPDWRVSQRWLDEHPPRVSSPHQGA